MATRLLLRFGDATNRCVFSNVQFHRVEFQGKNILKHRRNFRRVRNEEGLNVTVEYIDPTKKGHKIWKNIIFATTFSGATLVGATILEYERVRAQTLHSVINKISSYNGNFKKFTTGWRSEARQWWNSLTQGQHTFSYILFANVLVFLAWRVPRWQPVMIKYFMSNPTSKITCVPMLLCTFSHYNLLHLAANMFVLHSLSTGAVSYLGREHFLAVYLSSGVVASMFSNIYKIVLNRGGPSLGASGAIMGILAFCCTQFPDTRYQIIFLPQITFAAGSIIKTMMAFDLTGCVLGWKFFDHAAHLGGACFGLMWQSWGIDNIWRKRVGWLRHWHEFRKTGN